MEVITVNTTNALSIFEADDIAMFIDKEREVGFILTNNKENEWVTHQIRPENTDDRFWGHYFGTLKEAMEDFGKRISDSVLQSQLRLIRNEVHT